MMMIVAFCGLCDAVAWAWMTGGVATQLEAWMTGGVTTQVEAWMTEGMTTQEARTTNGVAT